MDKYDNMCIKNKKWYWLSNFDIFINIHVLINIKIKILLQIINLIIRYEEFFCGYCNIRTFSFISYHYQI